MSLVSTTNLINSEVVNYTPTVVAAVTAVEALSTPDHTGAEKAAAAVSAVAQSLAGSSNPNVASIASLVNLTVLIANLLGAFKHKAPKTP